MTALFYLSIFLFVALCAFTCLIVLIQENKSAGLGSALGGGDAGNSLLGTSTPQFLRKMTGWLAALFMVSSILLSFWTAGIGSKKAVLSDVRVEQVATESQASD